MRQELKQIQSVVRMKLLDIYAVRRCDWYERGCGSDVEVTRVNRAGKPLSCGSGKLFKSTLANSLMTTELFQGPEIDINLPLQ